ncbi:MAG: transposase [Kofleriaceae bacterium]
MPNPRQIFPGQFYLLTRRCTGGQFLLRPDAVTNNIFTYCLADAAKRFGIVVLLTVTEGNHHHTVFYDPHGRASEFMEHLHKMTALCLNRRWGRREHLWSSVEPCLTRLLDRAAVIAKLIYTAGNPVKDLLVERAVQWPGVNGYLALLRDGTLHARRPHYFFSPDGDMPEELTLTFEFPECLGTREEIITEIRDGVTALELTTKAERKGARVLGVRQAKEQSPFSSPTSALPRSDLRPRFAGGPKARIPALLAYKVFLAEYRAARRAWLAGLAVVFPAGTYRLRRIAPITVAPIPPPPLMGI